MIVSVHAAERWIERIDPRATIEEARAAINASARIVDIAAGFGCTRVITGIGARLHLQGDTVVTVTPRDRAYDRWRRG